PALADALLAELRVRRERLHMVEPGLKNFRRARQQIIRQGRGERLARLVEWHLLIERGTDPLGKAAKYLAIDHHRIDELAAVLDDRIVDDLDRADLGIDQHHGGMRRIAEGA